MYIRVTEKYAIKSDEHQYIVEETVKKKDSEETYTVDKSYHRTIAHALESICEKEVRASKARTFEGVQKEYEKMNKLLEEINKKLSLNIKGDK